MKETAIFIVVLFFP